MHPPEATITHLLSELKQGDRAALDAIIPLIYDELLGLAHRQRLRWLGDHTMDTTALVHEAYLKLANQDAIAAESRAHFLGVAARAMRHILCNYARDRHALKRGRHLQRVGLMDAAQMPADTLPTDAESARLPALDAALTRLEQEHPRRCRVVECRFFGGLSVEDTAAALGVSPRTVKRDWAAAQMWLRAEIASAGSTESHLEHSLDELAAGVLPLFLAEFAHEVTEEFAPGQHIAHYEIVAPLGHGGMGIVYKAVDSRLDRHVALKFLSPRLAADPEARSRLTHEARAASALDHPNICTIYDIGSLPDGRTFLAFACYDGTTLKERIADGALPMDDVVTIVRQIAAALDAAHRRGIVHRDIKPSNVMITSDGTVKILDFGIATVADREGAAQATGPGTVAYMSPEQTRGETPDGRTDLWSLGVVTHEMLTGARPFDGVDSTDLFEAIRSAPVASLSASRPDVPPLLQRMVETCLQKDRDARYRDAAELLADLRVLEGARGPQRSPSRRIAVLPLAGDTDDAYLADSLTGELVERLSRLGGLHVIARASTLSAVARSGSLAEVAAALDVESVVRGSIAAGSDDVAITLELVDAEAAEARWHFVQTIRFTALDAALRSLTWQLAGELAVQLYDDERRQLARHTSENAEAYALYLRGRYFWNKRDRASMQHARDCFQQALDQDPLFAHAWAGLADAFSNLGSYLLLQPQEAYPRARAAAQRALAIDEELPEAHASLATVLADYDWNWTAAGRHYRRALALNPCYATARLWYAGFLRDLGQFDAALAQVRAARELDPLSAATQAAEGTTLYVARRYDEAVTVLRRLLETDPAFGYANFLMALALVQLRNYDAASSALTEAGRGGAPVAGVRGLTGCIHAGAGRPADARRMLEAIVRTADAPHAHAFQRAVIHAALGEPQRALDLLEAACDARAKEMRLLRIEPLLDPLRGETRFHALLARVGLTDDDVARALTD
jgi:eukaryotic-like serine/threonine-protein kinase